jgi:hypothetical protein
VERTIERGGPAVNSGEELRIVVPDGRAPDPASTAPGPGQCSFGVPMAATRARARAPRSAPAVPMSSAPGAGCAFTLAPPAE